MIILLNLNGVSNPLLNQQIYNFEHLFKKKKTQDLRFVLIVVRGGRSTTVLNYSIIFDCKWKIIFLQMMTFE